MFEFLKDFKDGNVRILNLNKNINEKLCWIIVQAPPDWIRLVGVPITFLLTIGMLIFLFWNQLIIFSRFNVSLWCHRIAFVPATRHFDQYRFVDAMGFAPSIALRSFHSIIRYRTSKVICNMRSEWMNAWMKRHSGFFCCCCFVFVCFIKVESHRGVPHNCVICLAICVNNMYDYMEYDSTAMVSLRWGHARQCIYMCVGAHITDKMNSFVSCSMKLFVQIILVDAGK